MNNVNHEANFLNGIVKAKQQAGSSITMFEWDTKRNRYLSDIVESAWLGYCSAVTDITRELGLNVIACGNQNIEF